MFSLGEGEGPVPGEVPQISGCCSGVFLPTYRRLGAKDRLVRATDLPDLLHLPRQQALFGHLHVPGESLDLSWRLR